MRPVAAPGRRIWGLVGLAVALPLAAGGGWLITTAGISSRSLPQRTMTRVITVTQPVTTLNVQSYGGPVQVTAGPVHRVQVTEAITYDPRQSGPTLVTQSVSGGILTLTESACAQESDCSVGFMVTVPQGVGVAADTQGGSLVVSGTASASLDSGGGPVRVSGISGHLIVSTGGGSLVLSGLTGPLVADTGGGSVMASGVAAATATVITGGGQARIGFSAAPDGVFVSTDGGPAALTLPGGPYALTANTFGAPETVRIATDAAAGRSVTITTGGGPLQVEPPKNRIP
jgi:hypothetical protein